MPSAGRRPNQRLSSRRHGVKNDSRITPPEIFEAPTRRSTKMIGTSPTVQPASRARNSVSTWNDYPSDVMLSSGIRAMASRRQQRKPAVQSRTIMPVTVRTYQLAKVLRIRRRSGQFTTLTPCR